MIRKRWIGIIILGGTVLFLFRIFWRPDLKVLEAVPTTTELIVAPPRWLWMDTLPGGWAPFGEWWRRADWPEGMKRDMATVDALLDRLEAGPQKSGPLPILFLQESGPEGPALGAVFDLRNRRALLDSLKAFHRSQTTYRGQSIVSAELPGGVPIVFARYRNLLLFARFPLLVEEMVGHLTGNADPLPFAGDYKSGSSRLNLWVRTESIDAVVPCRGGLPEGIPSGWWSFNLAAREGRIACEGILWPDGGAALPEWWTLSGEGSPQSIFHVVPADVESLNWFGRPQEGNNPAGWSDSYFANYLLPVLGEGWAEVVSDRRGGEESPDRFLIFSLKDPEEGARAAATVGESLGVLKSYEYQTYPIRQLLTDNLFEPLQRFGAPPLRNPFFTQLDSCLIFAGSASAMELWIDQFLVGNTIAHKEEFIEFEQRQEDVIRSLRYLQPGEAVPANALQERYQSLWKTLSHMGFTLEEENGRLNVRGSCRLGDLEKKVRHRFVWRSDDLPSPIRGGPEVHRLGDQQVIVLQTDDLMLRVFGAGGRPLWQKALEAAVEFPLHSIDYYGDGQYQLAFNTRQKIHLIDFRGRSVPGFPLSLPAPASNTLTVTDLTGQGDFTFVIGLQESGLWAYDREGIPRPGWNPRSGLETVSHPILHFQRTGQDFFVALDRKGTMGFLKRNGDFRMDPVRFQDTFPSPPDYELYEDGGGRVVACNHRGVVQVHDLNGNHFPIRLGGRPPVHFRFADVWGDVRHEFITLSGDLLAIHGYQERKFRRIAQVSLDRRPSRLFTVAMPGSDKVGIGLVYPASGQIDLFSGEGRQYPGFPLAGQTPFIIAELYEDDRPVLIVGAGRSLYAYEIASGQEEFWK